MKILALDPAATTGFAWTDGDRREYGVWQITRPGMTEHPGARLERMRGHIYEAYRKWGFERLAYEDAQQGSHNFTVQGMHAELRGVIKLVACELDVETVAINPTTLKSWATGNGRADKAQVIRAAKTLLDVTTDDDNVADALFVLELAKNPLKIEGPKVVKRRMFRQRKRDPKLF